MKKPPFSCSFGSIQIKPLISADKDKYLSLASIDKLKEFLPDIDLEKNYDLLPISFNACVVNRANKNNHLITTATALDTYKTFIYKLIDLEHNRQKVVGCILTAGFSEFGTDKPLAEEQVKDLKGPFNIALGGVIWRTVNDDLANLIEDCADPESENHLAISASWELGYSGFSIAMIDGESKNVEDGVVISDKDEVEKLKVNLANHGGSGTYEGKKLYMCPSEGVLAVGIGLTENPAAEVKGVAVRDSNKDLAESLEKVGDAASRVEVSMNDLIKIAAAENENNISQTENDSVNNDRIDMKITSLKDITDDTLKVVKASAICDFITEEIKKAEDVYNSEKKSKEEAEKNHRDSLAKTEQDLLTTKAELDNLKAEFNKLQELISAKQKEDALSSRMAEFDTEYELDDEDRSVLVSSIKDLDDNAFAAYKKNAAVFFKNRKKGAKPGEKGEKPADKEVKASVEDKKGEVVADALDKAAVTTPPVTNTPPQDISLKDKYKSAFSEENILIKAR